MGQKFLSSLCLQKHVGDPTIQISISISSIKQVYQRLFELNSNQILNTKIN